MFEYGPNGGDKGIRTLDPLLAKQVLSQLSYIPMMAGCTRQRAPHENDSCTVIQYTQSSPEPAAENNMLLVVEIFSFFQS